MSEAVGCISAAFCSQTFCRRSYKSGVTTSLSKPTRQPACACCEIQSSGGSSYKCCRVTQSLLVSRAACSGYRPSIKRTTSSCVTIDSPQLPVNPVAHASRSLASDTYSNCCSSQRGMTRASSFIALITSRKADTRLGSQPAAMVLTSVISRLTWNVSCPHTRC